MNHIEMLTKAAKAAGFKVTNNTEGYIDVVIDNVIPNNDSSGQQWDPIRWNHEAMDLLTAIGFNLEFNDDKVCCAAPDRSVWAIEPQGIDRSSAARKAIVRAAAAYYDELNPEPAEDDQYSFRQMLGEACGAANMFHNALQAIDENLGGLNKQAYKHLREFVDSNAASGCFRGSDFAHADIDQLVASLGKLNDQGVYIGAFQPGTRVRKIGGGYQATGTIVSAFYTLAGDLRYVFEFDAFPGMLHIFNPKQLERNHESVVV